MGGSTYALFPTPVHHNNIGYDYKIEVPDLCPCFDSTIGPESHDKCNGLITREQNYLLREENLLLREKLEEVINQYLHEHLKLNKKVEIIGVGFSFQNHKRLPTSKKDIKMHQVFTEKGFI